ncbi:PREDICTED: uncharacterized protein LOC108547286 [Eufriesea mexicana]|uniref:uncharacterized protein LOC108547286 n=1 Tax=Eufriesea mexicana TaxID=516756 RepID=UPI00083C14BC|nr:PREDICTED: uncharacterized protein LOC108547286 [Eufriesea mexicana]
MNNRNEDASTHTPATIREYKIKRRTFKSQITQFGNWLDTYVDSDKERVKLRDRIERSRNQFATFNRIQDELSVAGNFEEEEKERQSTTDQFDDVMASAVILLERVDARATQPSPGNSQSSNLSSSSYALSVNLPKIDLPKFDGRIETWITFKDAFNTLIHTQPGLNKIQKLHYLRLSLFGKAEAAIGAFSITEDNYEAAWKHLTEIYDNTRVLVLRHAALLRDTPAMPDDSSESIRDLANHMQLHIRSLQALGRSSSDIANDLLASILIAKMGTETRRSWERTLSDTEVPKIEDLFKFLHNASHQSRDYGIVAKRSTCCHDIGKTKSNPTRNYPGYPRPQILTSKRQVYVTNSRQDIAVPPPSPSSQRRSTPPSSPRSQRRSTPPSSPRPQRRPTPPSSPLAQRRSTPLYGTRTRRCPGCDGPHAVYQCPRFLDATVFHRMEIARKAHLCLNCLQPDHRTDDCKAGGCRVCNQQHNTKLHQDHNPQPES